MGSVLSAAAMLGFLLYVSLAQAANDFPVIMSSLGRKLRTCGETNVPPCRIRAPRDIIFLVASDSMDPAAFYGAMLDYVQDLWCTLNSNDRNRGAVITFGGEVKMQIPLREYTHDEWFSAVEGIRMNPDACCRCCTPTAEAFRAARLAFINNPAPDVGGIPVLRICFVITDGDPWQNKQAGPKSKRAPLNPKEYWLWPDYQAAHYRFGIVPQEANKLKMLDGGANVRIMLIGVPNKFGQPPEQGYFSGIPDKALGKGMRQCITRQRSKDCYTIRSPPFPIISLPIEKNLFNSATWNVGELIEETVDDLCEILPTPEPTFAPTSQAPSKQPTRTPTHAPTPGPTFTPSKAPTRRPTHAPTSSPTRRPTFAPTFQPSKSPTQRPTKRPTPMPTHQPSQSPSAAPTEKEQFDGLDLFLLLDRSKSMKWRASDCRRAQGANPDADNDHVCWELFLYFARRIVERSTHLKYDGVREIGWQDNMLDKTKGLRVWMYGFACTGKQTVPVILRIGERITSMEQFNAALEAAKQMTPGGGTCPGAAIERTVGQIMANDLVERPYKAALLMTDGVFYDQPRPEQAAQGLFYFGVLTYALGIAIPNNGNNQGLTAAEVTDQRKQLLAFAHGDPTRVKNFGAEGINILDEIAQAFVEQIPIDVEKHFPRIFIKPYWCGFSNDERCLSKDPSTYDTSKTCKWVPNNPSKPSGNGRCVDKCPHTDQKTCVSKAQCQWFQGFCRPKALDIAASG